jgi:DNA polymerase-3 subunit epsilon
MCLVQPPDNEYTYQTIKIHGIQPADTVNSSSFGTVWPKVKAYFENELVVCHNKSFDILKLEETLKYYDLEIPEFCTDCTLQIYGGTLKKCCEEQGIEFHNHHDALADAEACAKLYLKSKGIQSSKIESAETPVFAKKKINKDDLVPDLDQCDPKGFFYRKKVVFTGDLQSMNRNEAAHKAKSLGADVKTSISKLTDLVVVGNKPGPRKMEKILSLEIDTIYEDEFLELIEAKNGLKE